MTTQWAQLATAVADRYSIEREVGSGGMATVYLAEDVKHRRRVAIKVLRPELAAGLGVDRFVREIEIAAQLAHPHILPLFDSGEAEGLLYYVMPYIEGESLRERLARDGKLDVEETIRLTDQVASALSYAHERGVVHRDIKPENIMLAGDQAIVADFGIARAVEAAGGERLTGTGLAIGTPAYMSPEQWSSAATVDARTDVYALGCVVYEMAGGRPPFAGTTPQELLAKHAAEPVPHLRTSDPEIPLFLERAVERALAKDPAERFASASQFAAALTSGTVVARVRQPGRRRWAAAGAAVTGVVALAVWALAMLAGGPRVERIAVLPLVNQTADSEQSPLVDGVHEALITELGQLGLSITSRSTMVQFRDTEYPLVEIARQLDVDGVIEGSVFRAGDSLEISARLYDDGGQQLWSGSFDGVLSNVVALYRGFARAIASEIQLQLSPMAEARLGNTRAVNPEVYEAYLRGMHVLHNRRTLADADSAIAIFTRAVERNPADPLAHAGLALGYATVGHTLVSPPEIWPRLRAAAERAIRLDSTLADGWAALADYKSYGAHDWAGAEQAFRRANELNPSLAMNHYHYAWYLILFGRLEEAVSEHTRAMELDPLTPLHTVWIPGLYLYARDYERAYTKAQEVVKQYPLPVDDEDRRSLAGAVTAHNVLARSAARLGLYDEAIEVLQQVSDLVPPYRVYLAAVYALAGQTDQALRIAEGIESQPITPYFANSLARVYAIVGDREKALHWLEYEPNHFGRAWLVTMPEFDAFRNEPRFQTVLRRMNLRLEPGARAPIPLPLEPPLLAGEPGAKAGATR